MIRTINSQDWPAFCQRITEQCATALVRLEVTETSGIKNELAANARLQSMAFDGTDPCNDVILLRVRDTREISHEILDPIQIRLHSAGTPGDFNQIEIAAENGITLIHLSPSLREEMLAGLSIN